MPHRLRLAAEVQAWLTGLRATDPGAARAVGAAVLALLEAGPGLGAPLLMPLSAALGQPDDPRDVLESSYQRRLESLQQVRRGVADVATSRKRIELQVEQLEQAADKLARRAQEAIGAGSQEDARQARDRFAAAQHQLAALRERHARLAADELKLTALAQRLQARVDDFRTYKETASATHSAARAARIVHEAFADMSEDMVTAQQEADDYAADLGAVAAAADELRQQAESLTAPGAEHAESADIGAPPGMLELRPDAPAAARCSLLLVIDPDQTVIVLAWTDDPGGPRQHYREPVRLAAERLAAARGAGPPDRDGPAPLPPSYDAESFLDEFFPGEETEVELAAAALAARHRAHTLAEARQRIGLTQAAVARGMNVRQERVSAIERAEPGATEIRTLAAYVGALGGTLEITATIGGERILLR